jgi:tetratricopeptide (TPR) repeat protein
MEGLHPQRLRAGALALAALCGAAFADRVVTVDGRVLQPKKAREHEQGYRLVFEAGEIVVGKEHVKAVEIEGDMSDYVPQNDDEREKLAQGFVRYQGRWWSKSAYEDQLAREHAASKKRTQEIAAHSEFANAWTKETKHFQVITNASPELLDYYADLLEAYYDLMDGRFKIKLSPAMQRMKMPVRIYKNSEEFHALNEAGAGESVLGYFSPATKDLNLFHDYQEPSLSTWVALHEGTHLLTHLIDPQYIPQIWINEAVADYFGSAQVELDKKGKPVITPGKLQTDRVLTVQQALQAGNDVKLEDLLFISRDGFTGFEYAHAWSFVYFLNETPKYKKGFDKFFKDLYTLRKGIVFEIVNYADISGTGKRVAPDEIRRVLLESLGLEDTAELEKEWKSFIAAIPIEGPEARFKRGYRAVAYGAMFEGDFDQNRKAALEDLDAAIEAGLRDARAYWARARLLQLQGDLGAAQKDLETAIAIDPLNASYRHAMGALLARGRKADEAPEALPFFGLAVELAPDNDFYRREHAEYTGS